MIPPELEKLVGKSFVFFEEPTIDNITNQNITVEWLIFQQIKKFLRGATFGSNMNVGNNKSFHSVYVLSEFLNYVKLKLRIMKI